MKHSMVVVILMVFLVTFPCAGATVMVSVRTDFTNLVISPSALSKAQQIITDIETNFMEEFFNQGHIAYNWPISIRTQKSPEKALSVEELLWEGAKGGAEILVYCTLGLEEIKPNEPIHVRACTVQAFSVHPIIGLPLSWALKVSDSTMEHDIQDDIHLAAQQISEKLK